MDPTEKATAVPAKPPPPSPGKAGKPTTLLDVYEVEWITRELERLLVRESGGGDASARADGHRHRRKRAKVSPPPTKPPSKKGGFLTELLGRHAVSICGDDTVDGAAGEAEAASAFREVVKV